MPAHDRPRLPRLATLVAAGTLCASHAVLGQDLVIGPKLRAGDAFRLEVTRSREESFDKVKHARSTTEVDVRVASVSEDGTTTLDWIPGGTIDSDGRTPADLMARVASLALEGLQLRMALTADGDFGLTNEREISPRLQAVTDRIVESVAEGIPEHDRQAFRALISQVISPPVLLRAATNDARTYFALNGVTIAPGETIEADLEQPNPLGAGSIPSRFRITAESATAADAVFATTTTFDGKAFMQMTRAVVEKTGKPFSEDELARIAVLEMTDEGRFVLDRATGLMREVKTRRRMRAATMYRLDEWDIRLVRAPQR